ncbi:MAG: multicopper oxidase domain-containing protein [Gemmatimonadaceae bacterium]
MGAGLPRHEISDASVRSEAAPVERIISNDNRRPAGKFHDGKLDLSLEVKNARWYPEAENGESVPMQAFGEVGRAPEIPGPLVRVPEGTEIHITVHNTLPDSEVVVHGFHTRPAVNDDVLKVPAGATREITFLAGAPGTYFYWGSTEHKPFIERDGWDSQLNGAIIVDPADPSKRGNDRVFVLGLWSSNRDTSLRMTGFHREMTVINGKSWPYTEKFTVMQGDTLSWRVINPTVAPHPMHLHGFYFEETSLGREASDNIFAPDDRRRANTQLVIPGATMAMRWVAAMPGNWLFHCHLALHVDGGQNLHMALHPLMPGEEASESSKMSHRSHEMAGLIIGIHVLPRPGAPATASTGDRRKIRLLIQSAPRRYGANSAMGFVLQDGAEPRNDSVTIPAPVLLLKKDQPVRITVVNKTKVETAVHWHGMEIESFPDGVPGWSGSPGKIFQAIAPADSFIAEFTPHRAGTFIYHSHVNEMMQTSGGMYGALIVTDSAHPFDPKIDKLVLIGGAGRGTPEARAQAVVNGELNPHLDLEAGVTYRLRVVQIHPQAVVDVRLFSNDTTLARWRPIAKDGLDLPASQATLRAAYIQMGAGETADFEFTPQRPGVQRIYFTMRRNGGFNISMDLLIRPSRITAAR